VTAEQIPEPPVPPVAGSSRLIDFEEADVTSPMTAASQIRLVVSGRKPWANMVVSLRPRSYDDAPKYWGIEVVGTVPTIGQPAIVPYIVSIGLDGCTGTAGVEVIGATRSEKLEVPRRRAGAGGDDERVEPA
jgi:hypothetical protein